MFTHYKLQLLLFFYTWKTVDKMGCLSDDAADHNTDTFTGE